MALNVVCHPVTVYVETENLKLDPVYVKGDGLHVQMKFVLCKKKHVRKPLRIKIGSNNKYIQATFVCGSRNVSIINAVDAKTPCIFDGFLNPSDESQTLPFFVSTLNTLNENHNLNVRKMALAMEEHTTLKVFVNEAIVNTSMVEDKWYKRLWFTETFLARKTARNEEKINCHETNLINKIRNLNKTNVINFDNLMSDQPNTSLWVPVQCNTGSLLVEFSLLFRYG
ncbi:ORF-122 [Buzura suppressaria nucleopolyhedrovirus]|uniref:ORF-122 n=1 Tax=Buzura suppressaria nuclear polyhedrosis virus TaxID=74320 RepID=W5VKP6_NPVBS|nr:ORF-122 [Buzura suppressaria nucleopolyhedrovirus]AHH82711.1 ORF-122 [Buzura suppressaria nucleopolyhedrovirus]